MEDGESKQTLRPSPFHRAPGARPAAALVETELSKRPPVLEGLGLGLGSALLKVGGEL